MVAVKILKTGYIFLFSLYLIFLVLLGFFLESENISNILFFGFEISAWTRSHRNLSGVIHFHGIDALPAFMARANFLVCLMPLTRETEGFLNEERLALLPNPAYLINLARGRIAVTEDVVAALKNGRLSGAFLDVSEPEPLPADSPLWGMNNVRITPHCSGPTNPSTAADQVAGNIIRVLKGDQLENLINRELGY